MKERHIVIAGHNTIVWSLTARPGFGLQPCENNGALSFQWQSSVKPHIKNPSAAGDLNQHQSSLSSMGMNHA